MTYPFSFGFVVTDRDDRPITGDALDAIVDALMDAMVERETEVTYGSGVGATLATGEVDVDLEVSASDPRTAAVLARDFVIEAIRVTGGVPIGLFTFPSPSTAGLAPEWHERRAELTHA